MTWMWLALVVWVTPGPRVQPPLASLPPPPGNRQVRLDQIGATVAGFAAVTFVPLPAGLVVACLASALAFRALPRHLSRGGELQELALARALPDAVDLLGAVLRAGLTDVAGLAIVAAASPEPLKSALGQVSRHRSLGATAPAAWRCVSAEVSLAELARAMSRYGESGSAVAAVLDRVAADARSDYYARAQAAARAAAVRSVVPLAACFLPAFALLGVVPIVASFLAGLRF